MSARPRLLIIKTSSLGDVVHALPVVSDIAAAGRDWEIDWTCEEAFADIPALHPGIARVIPCAIRRWRQAWWSAQTREEAGRFKAALRAHSYDVVLDLQGLLKSAWIARAARGVRHGYDWGSAREPLATLAYDVRHAVAREVHAIARNRQLAAATLGYALDGAPRYGVAVPAAEPPAALPYAVALHATSRADKLWPEADWRTLLAHLAGRGLRIVLPWGSAHERARSERLAAGLVRVAVPPRMSPRELAGLFSAARVVIGVDTGLLHLAVAAGAPALALFGPTNPVLTGVQGEKASARNLGGNGVAPDAAQAIAAVEGLLAAGAGLPAIPVVAP
ncbi:MAG: lipopolysaccharide heptosyltransferase I [Betaproteobacteria bacterium]|nr:lipopolysaccharide heptosyltransferase I [Betaproteobacteria bacterium]